MDEQLSVVVPVYNSSKYLVKCIKSIINQSYKELEIILVDDGSSDNSGEICESYAKCDVRVKVLHKENGGLISARYAGLLAARSTYITFVDSDDWIKEEMYSNLMNRIVETDADMVTSGKIVWWSDEDLRLQSDDLISEGIYEKEDIAEKIIPVMMWDERINNWAFNPSLCYKIMKTDLLKNIYSGLADRNFTYGEDSAVTYPYILVCNRIIHTHEVYYYHRQRENGKLPEYVLQGDFFSQLLSVYEYLKNIFDKSIHKDILIKQLDFFFLCGVSLHNRKYNVRIKQYYFPFKLIPPKCRIILYGAGLVGRQYFLQIGETKYCDIVLWVDKNHLRLGDGVTGIEKCADADFDFIVVAVADKEAQKVIRMELLMMEIDERKIVFGN